GMGKVKSVNQYRLTPGFGGFIPVSYAATVCRLPCPDGHLKPRSDTLETVKRLISGRTIIGVGHHKRG
ncbi:hypothetical protein ACM0T4_004452, partial [Escherichia coli]